MRRPAGDVADIVERMGLAQATTGIPSLWCAMGPITWLVQRSRQQLKSPGATLVDGDSSAGVIRPTGQGRARWPDTRPVLVSVVPAGLVTYPGACRDRVPLEENHSHSILADSTEWGGETRLLMAVADMLARHGRVAVVLAGGGQVATAEALETARPGWPIFAVGNTGGLADDLRLAGSRCAAPIAPVIGCSACIFIRRGRTQKCALMPPTGSSRLPRHWLLRRSAWRAGYVS